MPAELDTLHPVVFVSSYVKMLTGEGEGEGDSDAPVVISRGECLETPHGTCLLVAGLQLCDLISLDESLSEGAGTGSLKHLQKVCTGILGGPQPTLMLLSEQHGLHLQIAPAELRLCSVGWGVTLLEDRFEKEGGKLMKQLYGDRILRLESLPAKPEARYPVVVIDNLPKFLAAPSSAAAPASAADSPKTGEDDTAEANLDQGSLNEVS